MNDIYHIPNTLPPNVVTSSFNGFDTNVFYYQIFDCDVSTQIIDHFSKIGALYPVGKQGLNDDSGIGSHRMSTFDVNFAKFLNPKIEQVVKDACLCTDEFSSVDTKQYHGDWKFKGVSPFFRYMEYSNGGEHFPHYDAPYFLNDNVQTLLTGVLYLTSNRSGCTIFVEDDRNDNLAFIDRDTSDWTVQCEDSQIIQAFEPQSGSVLLFPHQTCHAVSMFEPQYDERRIIVRFDVYFEKVDV